MSQKPYSRPAKKCCVPDKCCTPEPECPEEEPCVPMLYSAGDIIPINSVGLVTVVLKSGISLELSHGSVIPVDIAGFVIMDACTMRLKHVPAPTTLQEVQTLIDTTLDGRNYITSSQLQSAIDALVIPDQITEPQIKAIINACLLERNYMSSAEVCLLLDSKIPAAIAAVNLEVDPEEVNAYIQSYLDNNSFVTLTQVKSCIADALDAFDPDPNQAAIKAIVLDCFKDVLEDLSKDGFSYVESATFTCSPSGFASISLKQSGASDITIPMDLSKLVNDDPLVPVADTNSYVSSGSMVCSPAGLVTTTLQRTDGLAPVTFSADLSKFFDDTDTNIDTNSYVSSGSMVCNAAGLVTTTLQRTDGLAPVVFTADLSKFLDGGTGGLTDQQVRVIVGEETTNLTQCLTDFTSTIQNRTVTLAIQQDNCGTVNTQFTIPESTGGTGGGEVTGLTLTCNAQKRVTFGLNQTVGQAQTVTADFTSCFPDTNTLTETSAGVALAINAATGRQVLPVPPTFTDTDTLTETAGGVALTINPATGRQVLPTAAQAASTCVDSIAHVVTGNQLTTTIVQDNCPNKTSTVNLPVPVPACINDYNHVISGGVLTSTIKQDGCSDKVAVVTLPATTGGSDNCISNHILSINNNVLTSTITQDSCPTTTASVTLPTGAVSSTVISGSHVCNTAGTLTTTINQSGGSPVSFSADLSKFLDNTDTNTTVVSGGMTCSNGVVTTTINQSSGPAVTFNADLSSCFGSVTDNKLQSVVSDVVNANSQNSRIDLDYTLTDSSVVTGSISGVDLAAALKAFITCVEVTEPGASCQTYNSLRFDGSEICKLPAYVAPAPYCQSYCVGNIAGQADGKGFIGLGSVKATTDNGSQYTVTWTDGTMQTVNSGSTASFNFDGEPGQITICHEVCANITELIITPIDFKDTISNKGCGC